MNLLKTILLLMFFFYLKILPSTTVVDLVNETCVNCVTTEKVINYKVEGSLLLHKIRKADLGKCSKVFFKKVLSKLKRTGEPELFILEKTTSTVISFGLSDLWSLAMGLKDFYDLCQILNSLFERLV